MNSMAWLSLVILLAGGAAAQPARPAFQIADVHASSPGVREAGGFLPEGRYECQGLTMLKLIATAYNVATNLVVGGPDWLSTDRFDITARAASGQTSTAELRKMLQTLLADRFGLAVHEDRKEMPVYFLAVGQKGPKLKTAARSSPSECPSVEGDPDLNQRDCRAFSMADLSRILPQIAQNYVDRPVVDKTGLEGRYDFQLDWMSKANYLSAQAVGRPAVAVSDALEKLGLTLEPGTGPAPVIAVDHVNRAPAPEAGGSKTDALLPTEFDAAEVRPSKSKIRQGGLTALPSGQIEMMGYTLRELLWVAFDVKGDRLTGGPKWLDTERFDVIAKSREALSPHVLSGMLKTLLVREFKLETHTESKPVTVFALVPGRGEPKLQPGDASARSECKLRLAEKGRAYACQNTSMAQFVERLPDVAQAYFVHPFADLTGLEGGYDFVLTWTPKSRLPAAAPAQPAGGVGEASTPDGDVTVFGAIERQLGLRVEERKQPMPVIVVDHAEKNI